MMGRKGTETGEGRDSDLPEDQKGPVTFRLPLEAKLRMCIKV